MGQPRWFTETKVGHSQWYVDRFRQLAADGDDLAGEARLVDAMVPPRSRILDAGCGPGRVAAALHERGHRVLGVDVDPVLIDAARTDHPGPRWVVRDLAELTPDDLGGEPVDAVVVAGNVMVFLAPGSEATVLARLAAVLRPGGRIVAGFRLDGTYPLDRFDHDLAAAGLRPEQRFATWHLDPFESGGDFAVTIARRP